MLPALLALLEPITPLVVRVVEEPTREHSVADVLMSSVGLVGVILLVAAVAGLVLGGVLVGFRMIRAGLRAESTPSEDLRDVLHTASR